MALQHPWWGEAGFQRGIDQQILSDGIVCSHSSSIEQILCPHGSFNVPIEHHPTIRYMVYNGYYKVMSNTPKMGQLPIPGPLHKAHKLLSEANERNQWDQV